MVDIAFEVDTSHDNFENIPLAELITALEKRLAALKLEKSTEAFGNCS